VVLDDMANVIERALPETVREGGRDTTRRLKKEAQAIGAAVRDWKQNVLLQGVAGFQMVQASIAKMLVHFVNREWSSLEHRDPEPAAVVRTHWAFRAMRVIIVAGLPYAVLRIVESGGFIVPGVNVRQLETYAVYWAVARFLLVLEPQAGQVAGLTKDLGTPAR